MYLYRHYYTAPKHQIPFDLNANAIGLHKVELNRRYSWRAIRRRTSKVSVYWMLLPMDNRMWHENITDRELKNISAVRNNNIFLIFFPPGATQLIVGVYFTALYRALTSSRTKLLDHIQRRATVGRNPLNEWSVRSRDLYLTTHNTHNRQTSMPRVGFEPRSQQESGRRPTP
jgi:hypothetical protein